MTVESTGFKASDVLAGNLQKVLTDVTALSLVGKQLHWNITGDGFRSLHLFLDDVVDIAREASDEIAERMRALQVVPNGLPEVVAQRNTLPTVPETLIKTDDAEELAVAAINATVGTMRDVHEKVDAEDSASADILNDYIRRFEQQAWFIRSERPGLSLTPPRGGRESPRLASNNVGCPASCRRGTLVRACSANAHPGGDTASATWQNANIRLVA